MFQIKICGVREIADVEAVSQSGADAIGWNFFPPSCRFLDPENASTLQIASKAAQLGLSQVGVFVNHPIERILAISARLGIDAVQLHGDESPEFAMQLKEAGVRQLIRAIKLPVESLTVASITKHVEPWISTGAHLLLDSDGGRQHGGTGKTLDWTVVRDWALRSEVRSWTLAGGLNPENIATAIEQSGARSVDTASGVEITRGEKSAALIGEFASIALPLL